MVPIHYPSPGGLFQLDGRVYIQHAMFDYNANALLMWGLKDPEDTSWWGEGSNYQQSTLYTAGLVIVYHYDVWKLMNTHRFILGFNTVVPTPTAPKELSINGITYHTLANAHTPMIQWSEALAVMQKKRIPKKYG